MTNVKEVIQVNSCKEGVICENYVITQRIVGSEIIIPMIMVKGKKEGPSLLVVFGTHGDEPEGHFAFLNLM